jgi:hypothetical protein
VAKELVNQTIVPETNEIWMELGTRFFWSSCLGFRPQALFLDLKLRAFSFTTGRTGQAELDRQNWTDRIGQTELDGQKAEIDGQKAEIDSQKLKGRT